MKLRDYIAIGVLIVTAILSGAIKDTDNLERESPRRPDPRQFGPASENTPISVLRLKPENLLPDESPLDPRIVVKIEKKKSTSTGTAFSIDDSGVWITAHHVTSGCDMLGLQNSNSQLVRVHNVTERPDADISILRTKGGAPRMNVIRPQLRVGQDGYSFGFPQGTPGAVYGKVIGRGRMLTRGRYRKDEPVVAWIQVRRIPDIGADLAGISGGPWVDAAGAVIGVHVAGSPRRGRSYSTSPKTLLAAIKQSEIGSTENFYSQPPKASLNPRGFARYGEFLRREKTIAKVVCLVGKKWRPNTER